MRASVIIPTYNGAAKIVPLLDALRVQSIDDFEVVVVVDGSTDNTLDVVAPYKDFFHQLIVVPQNNGGRSVARNAGVAKASSDVLIFYDDDMAPAKDSVEKHVIFHSAHTKTVLVGHALQAVFDPHNDFQQYRLHIHHRWMMPFGAGRTTLGRHNAFMSAANCSMLRATFTALNGFDETLSDAEDKDLGLRAVHNGMQLVVDMENVALHRDSVTCRTYIRRLRQYAVANVEIERRHPDSVTKASVVSPGRKMIYKMLAHSWWVAAVDSGTFTTWLPRRVRYRLYDAITFSLSELYPDVAL